MNSWQDVVDDVCKNTKRCRRFLMSDLEAKAHVRRTPSRSRRYTHSKPKKVYFISQDYINVYFTQREVECIYYLLKCYRLSDIAVTLGISIRTVEFYVKNMKSKLHCHTRQQLIEKIAATDLMARIKL